MKRKNSSGELSKTELLGLFYRIASEDNKSISLNRSYRELTNIFVYVTFID